MNSNKNQINIANQTVLQLSNELNENEHRSSSEENIDNPFPVIKDGSRSKSHWIHHYSNDSPILEELYNDVLNQPRQFFKGIFNRIKAFFGDNPHQKLVEKWSELIQSLIDQSLHESSKYPTACDLLQIFRETKSIEPLLKLYTLHKDFCEDIGKSRYKTDFLFAPIYCYLHTIEYRSYQGDCYRGLTMSKDDFDAYRYAFKNPRSYVRTIKFSASNDLLIARGFAVFGDTERKIEVLLKFHFTESEVLILPGTIFSVKEITDDEATLCPVIHLEHFDTVEVQAEMAQDRLKSFLDAFVLDD